MLAAPDYLLRKGIYSEVAVGVKGGAWRHTSMALLTTRSQHASDVSSEARVEVLGLVACAPPFGGKVSERSASASRFMSVRG